MVRAVDDLLGHRVDVGLLTEPASEEALADPGGGELRRPVAAVEQGGAWSVIPAGHPIPDPGSERAGRMALELARDAAGPDELLLVCLSGGASAMLAVPARGLTLADKAAATAVLLRAGLSIGELNLVRRHLSAIKGGRLGALARRSVTLAISDVPVATALEPETIGSGPTVGHRSRRRDALAVLGRHGLTTALPHRVVTHLEVPEAPGDLVTPDDIRLAGAAYWVVASRHDAMQAAAVTARRQGYETRVLSDAVTGPAVDGWRPLVDAARDLSRPACVVASGETTVKVVGEGRGGRNQELAAAALETVSALGPAALASIGTDGIDGPTDAAGAFVDSEMWARLGPEARATVGDAIARHDSYPLLERLGALVRTGPTGTNVADLIVLLLH